MESWIHTSKNSGTGDSAVDITVDSNKMSDIGRPSFQRTGTIMVATPQILKEYSIKQEGDMVLIEFEDFNYDGTNFNISAIVVDGQKFQVTNQSGVLICPQTYEILNLIQGKTILEKLSWIHKAHGFQ